MQLVRFTKFWAELGVQEIGQRAVELGYDGLDLVVRSGHAVNPENVAQVLPQAVRSWASLGISCPLITAETSLTDAQDAAARALFHAAAEAQVPRIKIGYFQYQPGTDFEVAWSRAVQSLKGFEALSRETGVQTLYHTHSGLCLGSNCAGLRHLLEGFDPRLIGAYVDLGHLAVNGEDVRMGLAMLRDRLSAVAAKDARHFPDQRPSRRAAYADAFVPLGQGAAEWGEAMRLLHQWGFQGPLVVHTEYTMDQDVVSTVGGWDDTAAAETLRQHGEQEDLQYLRRLWREVAEIGS